MEDVSKVMPFSLWNDPKNRNNPDTWHQAWRKIEIGKPATFGGVFKDAQNSEVTYEQYITSQPPAIPPNTRIIAVCGVPQEDAAPSEDGWMISDFLAMYQLYKGLTQNQRWIHALDFRKLLAQHTRYVHGNPYKDRKVVLDKNMYDANVASDLNFRPVEDSNLCQEFTDQLRLDCGEATKYNQNILILMFGHGSKTTANINKNDPEWKRYKNKLALGNEAHLGIQQFLSSVKPGKNVKVMMISTACFSGGWVCSPQLNMSAMTLASYEKKSKSWIYSGSIGQHCGSMGVSALIEKLTYDHNKNRSLQTEVEDEDTETTDEQEETMAEFGRTVTNALYSIDRRAYTHELAFKAQNDKWSGQDPWPTNAIPQDTLKDRWNQLPVYAKDPTLHIGDPMNRDPDVPQNLRDEYLELEKQFKAGEIPGRGPGKGKFEKTGDLKSVLQKRKIISVYGGTIRSYTNLLKSLAAEYQASCPGDDPQTPA